MILIVGSGLTSRLRTIADAYAICKIKQWNLDIRWPLDYMCGAKPEDILDIKKMNDVSTEWHTYRKCRFLAKKDVKEAISKRHYFSAIYKAIRWILIRKFFSFIKIVLIKAKIIISFYPPKHYEPKSEEYKQHIISARKELIQRIDNNIEPKVDAFCGILSEQDKDRFGTSLHSIKFKEEIVNAAEKINVNSEMIGLHIRRTDHAVCIRNSPREAFVEIVEKQIKQNPSSQIYLATDDEEEEKFFKDTYGETIVTIKHKAWEKDSIAGIKTAIIEMLCLSQCKEIYGSYTSVFSGYAAEYGNIDLWVCSLESKGKWYKVRAKK